MACRSLSALLEKLVGNLQEQLLFFLTERILQWPKGLISEGYNSEEVLETTKENFVKANNTEPIPLQSSPSSNTENSVWSPHFSFLSEVCHETCLENTSTLKMWESHLRPRMQPWLWWGPHHKETSVTAHKLQLPGAPGTHWVASIHVHPTLTASQLFLPHSAHCTATTWYSKASTCVAHSSSGRQNSLAHSCQLPFRGVFCSLNGHCWIVHKQT